MDDKRSLIALVLMMAIWMGYTILFPPTQAPPPATETAQVEEPAAAPEVTLPPVAVPATPSETLVLPTVEKRDLVIETDLYIAVLSSQGGTITSFELKNYREENTPEAPLVNLLDQGMNGVGTLALIGEGQFDLQYDSPYQIDVNDSKIQLSGDDTREVRLTTQTRSGLTLTKILTFSGNQYPIGLTLSAKSGDVPLQGKLGLALRQPWDDTEEVSAYTFVGPVTRTTDDKEQVDIEDIAEDKPSYGSNTQWTAFVTKYFIRALVFGTETAPSQVLIGKQPNLVENLAWSDSIGLPVQGTKELQYTLFFGPRDMKLMETAGNNLEESMDYGIFAPLAQPLLWVLKYFYGFIGNYGWAIILLTVVIKMLFWPLTQKSYSSMKAMQKLQPQMQKLREKYKNDKQRLNMEMMALYKTHRVNPMGGCLPMLIQIPVFFALYKVLLGSVELRHAPFMFYLNDLSAPDPYYITPLIMGASMFLQQKLSPSTMDPAQAKIFMMMPVVFTFMFLNFPSGLVIYWLVNNLLSIAQQLMINRSSN